MGCPVQHDLNNHLTLIDKQDRLEDQAQSELIDGDHLDTFIDDMPESAFNEAMAYLLQEVVAKNKFIGEEFEAYKKSLKKSIEAKINKRIY